MATPEFLIITDGVAEASVAPRIGAGLGWYDLVGDGRREPLFRPCRDLAKAAPFDLANNLLVPWSNRISGGGFNFAGEFHALEPNIPGESVPNHGNGFSSVWTIERALADSATLSLNSVGPGPFRYAARVRYGLEGGALEMQLSVTNVGDKPLPFGLGLHPWLARTPQTLLQAKAQRVVLENNLHLPAGDLPVSARKDWNFESPRRLPGAWINNAFTGWDGKAVVTWPDRELSLEISADPPLATYIVYSPSSDADHFCFEPVTHPVDAHNLPGGAQANGLVILKPSERLSISCRFAPRNLG
jgi:aldose 1-epimerase